jgi:hypothetical protein
MLAAPEFTPDGEIEIIVGHVPTLLFILLKILQSS